MLLCYFGLDAFVSFAISVALTRVELGAGAESELDFAFFCRSRSAIAITFYSPSCLGQETAKGPFGLRVKLPHAHLSTTHGGGFILSLLMLNVKQESCEYQFL